MTVPLLRTLLLYLMVLFAVRLMGKRQIGEVTPSELVITILISDLAAVPMQDLGIPLLAGVVPILTLVTVEILLSWCSLKSRRINRLLNGHPAIIIRKGLLDTKKLQQLRLTTDEIVESLRRQNVSSIADVKYGVIEPDGQLTVVLYTVQQNVTASMLSLTPPETGLPMIVVANGRVIDRSLRLLRMEKTAVLGRLKNKGVQLEDVFLMTLDDAGNMFLQKKEGA